jgi:hypothetical protein
MSAMRRVAQPDGAVPVMPEPYAPTPVWER